MIVNFGCDDGDRDTDGSKDTDNAFPIVMVSVIRLVMRINDGDSD